jgi:hypothetical protein
MKRSGIALVPKATSSRASQTLKLHWRYTRSMAYRFCRTCVGSFRYVYMTQRLRSSLPHVIGMPLSPCITQYLTANYWYDLASLSTYQRLIIVSQIASEMKAFLPFGWQPEWDVQSIKDVGWLCDGRTIFKGVSKILPGHYLVCRSFDTISQDKYWDVDFKDKVCAAACVSQTPLRRLA